MSENKGIIKKLKMNELVGHETDENLDVYPITAFSAVYDENNVSLADYIKGLNSGSGDGGFSNLVPVTKTKFLRVYKSSATQPSVPEGGSYDFSTDVLTVPSGWSETSNGLDNPVWMSMGSTLSTSNIIVWSAPVCIAGSVTESLLKKCYVAIIYMNSVDKPSRPTGGSYDFDSKTLTVPEGWGTETTVTVDDDTWCSIRAFYSDDTETEWSDPVKTPQAKVTLTAAELDIIAGKINLTANELNYIVSKITLNTEDYEAVAQRMKLTTDELAVVANSIELTSTFYRNVAQRMELSADDLAVIANNVNLNADNIAAIAKKVELDVDDLKVVANNIDVSTLDYSLIANNIKLSADDLAVIADNVSLSTTELQAIAKNITLSTSDLNVIASNVSLSTSQLQTVADNIELSANELSAVIAGVETDINDGKVTVSANVDEDQIVLDVIGRLNTSSLTINNGASYFGSNGSGYVANQNVSWDTSGNTTVTGTFRTGTNSGTSVSISESSGYGTMNLGSYISMSYGSLTKYVGMTSVTVNGGIITVSDRSQSAATVTEITGSYVTTPKVIATAGLTVIGGNVMMFGLPTSKPSGSGYLWNDNGTLKIS